MKQARALISDVYHLKF